MRRLLIVPVLCLMTGCGIFKEARRDIPPPEPRLDYKQDEAIREQAKANYDLAKYIREHGTQANSEWSITLEDGSKVIYRYLGEPFKDVDGQNLKEDKKIIDEAKDVTEDWLKEGGQYDDKLAKNREKIINQTNLKWNWARIFGGGIITWIVIGIGVPVLCALFPVIIPFVQIAWQVLKAGIGAIGIVAKLGLGGIKAIISAVESFRDSHKGTEVGKAFDDHMAKSLDSPVKEALDKFKNHFGI